MPQLDGDRGEKRWGAVGAQAIGLVSGETAEHLVTAEIAATSFHASRAGGGVLIGRDQSGALRRAVIGAAIRTRDPETGETWRVTGPERAHIEYGLQIYASVALPLLPTGHSIVRYLATSKRFPGIGWATASGLWDRLGDRLYTAIRDRDLRTIADVIGAERAVSVVDNFGLLIDEVEIFQWLDRYGVSPRTAVAVASIWGRGAIAKIEVDPYALSLFEPWRAVDDRALRLGVKPTDRRRLLAAVEEALAHRFQLGDTAANGAEAVALVASLLGPAAASLASAAIEEAVRAGRVVEHPGGLLQGRAIWFMEREIERVLGERLLRECLAPSASDIDEAIATIEAAEGYSLTNRQREAVYMAVSCALSVLCGGAGTGKTTTVRAILEASERRRSALPAHERREFDYPQVALAGRAVKRIAEATGREASTIARFLRQLEIGRRSIRRGLMIFDESSMLDLRSVYRMLIALPPLVDLLFIGDPGQLPPIGPGLVFHRMVEAEAIPQVKLDIIHRQAAETGIPAIADQIRQGHMSELPAFNAAQPLAPGVFLVEAADEASTARSAIEVFHAMAGPPPTAGATDALHSKDVQLLCPVKHRAAGSKAINREIEARWMADQPQVHDWGLSVGSKILWLRNDYAKAPLRDIDGKPILDEQTGTPVFAGFMNGALGIIRRQTERGAWLEFDDGAEDEIRAIDLELLTHGWAVSVHKAQGSAFRRVIVPIARSRLLDRTMVYTAVTRAIDTVVLVGDPALIRQVVEAPPRAHARRITLSFDGLMDSSASAAR